MKPATTLAYNLSIYLSWVGALGLIKKGTDKHINNRPENRSLYEIFQKIAICGTVLLPRRMWKRNTEKSEKTPP